MGQLGSSVAGDNLHERNRHAAQCAAGGSRNGVVPAVAAPFVRALRASGTAARYSHEQSTCRTRHRMAQHDNEGNRGIR